MVGLWGGGMVSEIRMEKVIGGIFRQGRYNGIWRELTDALAAKVRHLRDLVREHCFHCLRFQDLCASLGALAVVQESCDDLAVLGGFGETARAAGVESLFDFVFGSHE